jgi:hypothetical protein
MSESLRRRSYAVDAEHVGPPPTETPTSSASFCQCIGWGTCWPSRTFAAYGSDTKLLASMKSLSCRLDLFWQHGVNGQSPGEFSTSSIRKVDIGG